MKRLFEIYVRCLVVKSTMFLPIGGDRCLRDPIGGVDHPLIQLNIRGGNACLDLIHFPHSLGIQA